MKLKVAIHKAEEGGGFGQRCLPYLAVLPREIHGGSYYKISMKLRMLVFQSRQKISS